MARIDLRPFDEQVIMGVPDACEMIIAQAENGVACTGVDKEGNIIVIGGVAFLRKGVGSGWVLTSELMVKYKVWTHRIIRDILDTTERVHNLHRIESLILKGHTVSMNWVERLGFEQEGLLKQYDSHKQDHWLYARVR